MSRTTLQHAAAILRRLAGQQDSDRSVTHLRTQSLSWWRGLADAQLTPLQEAKDALRQTRQALDTHHPSWKAAFDANPTEYVQHDARREYFVTLQVILSNAQLTYVFMKEHLCDESWWQKKAGAFRLTTANQSLREQALMLKFFSIHAMAAGTEETLRAIARTGAPFTCDASAPFASLFRHILRVTELQSLEPLFQLLRLIRNTIHNNGVHRPNNGRNESITYAGRTLEFVVGQELFWLTEDFIPWIARHLGEAMKQIVTSHEVARIDSCPRFG